MYENNINVCCRNSCFFHFFRSGCRSRSGTKLRYEKNGQNPFRIVGFKDYPPFSWAELDEQSYKDSGFKSYTYNGFILDPLKQSLEEIGIVRTKPVVFDRFNDALRAMLHGKADLLFTGYYIDESKSGLDYIYPAYFGNPFIVLSRKSKKLMWRTFPN